MVRFIGRAAAVVAVTVLGVLGGVGAASADPGNAPGTSEVPLVCNDGNSYTVIVNGRGAFTPGHDVGSNTILVPTMFGPFHGVVTQVSTGTVLDDFTEPAVAKGSSTKTRATSVSCTYTIEQTGVDPAFPELGPLHFVGNGSVIGFTTPAH